MTFDDVLTHLTGVDHSEPPHPQPYAPAEPGSLREQMELETARSHVEHAPKAKP